MSVMVLQGPKSTPQKSRPLESGHRRYSGVRLAIKYSYKLGQKMNLNFNANMAGFCRDSHKLFLYKSHGLHYNEEPGYSLL